MALDQMEVFNKYFMPPTIETLAQMVEKFNAASRGSIRLSTTGFEGDFLQESFWASIHSAVRRVERIGTNGDVEATDLSQLKNSSVKVAGGFGPIRFEPSQMTWLLKPTTEGVEVISRNLSEAMMKDMLNTAIAALVAAIEAQGSDTTYDTGTGPMGYRDINRAHAKFGDMSGLIVANVMDGPQYHELVDQNLQNTARLFTSTGVNVVDVLGRVIVVTDAPALRESGTGGDVKVLGLVDGAAIVHDAGDLITNIETVNGKERIETTLQADYTFGLGLKGYTWDVSNGGASPTDAKLATGSNWDKTATSIKHTAGVLALADA
jgi:hypothetical protein